MPPICEGQPADGPKAIFSSMPGSIYNLCIQTVHKISHYYCCIQSKPINDEEREEDMAMVQLDPLQSVSSSQISKIPVRRQEPVAVQKKNEKC